MCLLEYCHQVFSPSPARPVSDVNRNRLLVGIQELNRIVVAEFVIEATNSNVSGPEKARTLFREERKIKILTKAAEKMDNFNIIFISYRNINYADFFHRILE